MDKAINYYDNTLRPYSTRPASEALSYDTPNGNITPSVYGQTRNGRHSSLARRRWAASMHAMYMVRLFESFIHNPFYALVLSLRMFGLTVNIGSKNPRMIISREQQIRNLIGKSLRYTLTGFMILYILYYSVRTTVTITKGGIWTNLKVLINAWITLWTVCLFLYRNSRIGELMVQLQSVNAFVKDISPTLKRHVMIAIGVLWIYLAISVVTFYLDFAYHKAEDIFVVNYGEWPVSGTVAALVVYTDTILSVYFVRGTLLVIIFTYILLNHCIETLYKDLKDFTVTQNKQTRELTLKGLQELKKRHHLLAHYTQEVDYIFSFVVFLWFILVIVSFCIRVNTITAGEYSSANLEGWVSSIWSIGITLLIVIGVTLSASFVTDEAVLSALSVETLANSHTTKNDNTFYFELILFMSRICVNPIALTCYKFFPIKKLLILVIALLVITYYFFVLHFDILLAYINRPVVNTT